MSTTETTGPVITEQSIPVWNGRLTIRVKVAGAGAPLLYLHPAAGLAWDPFLSHLAQSYTVYAPEFPGTSAGDPYAIHAVDHLPDVVLIYEEVVRALGLHKPVVVGQSFGGMLAAELAAAFPELPSKVVLLDPIGLWRDDLPIANWIATHPTSCPHCCSTTPPHPQRKPCSQCRRTRTSPPPRSPGWCGRSDRPASSPGRSQTGGYARGCTA